MATPSTPREFILVDSRKVFTRVLPPGLRACHNPAEVEAALAPAADFKRTIWITFTRRATNKLVEKVADAGGSPTGSGLITLRPPLPPSLPALLALFYPVFGLGRGARWLPTRELLDAITTDDSADRFIGGSADPKTKTLTLIRGDVTAIVAPFAVFSKSGDGISPDFARLRLTDYGRTIALGTYEASADAVFYKLDAGYRRRLKRQRRERTSNN